MIYRTYTEKPNIVISILKNLTVSTIPVFGLIHAYNHNELWKWLLIYLPLGIVGYYIVGTTGVIVDFENNRFKIFKSLFFGDIGKWERLPYIDRVVLKNINELIITTDNKDRSWTKTGRREMHYKIALINSHKEFILEIIDTKNKKEAYELGESIANDLNLKLENIKL